MDDKSASTVEKKHERNRLGMSSFGPEEREQFGQKVRLAIACIEGSVKPVNTKAMPDDEEGICQRLKLISQDKTSAHADLLELLVRFDDLEGWKSRGANYCAAWMNLEMGISPQLGWEYLRVGRKLRALPTTTALFRAGKLSWSKIRLIVSVATAENEKTLCHAALDASFTEVKRICSEYRWNDNSNGEEENENDRALKQWASRSLTWNETSIGSTRIQLVLPPDLAQAFLNSVEQSLQKMGEPPTDQADMSISQQRADAAVLMAETSLQAAGKDIATADRYQVIVSVNATELSSTAVSSSHPSSSCTDSSRTDSTPAKKPTLKGTGPIARETARRIACDCSVTTNTIKNGEPTDIGRKSRVWPSAMARAIKDRDQHCQFNGCTRTHNLKIHHIVHWADGGTTCIENGVSLCQSCHTKVHEGGYTIQRVDHHEQRLNEQFEQQIHADDAGLFNFEKDLRNDRESFIKVRRLSPTRYRFRVLDSDGRDIRSQVARNCSDSAGDANVSKATHTRTSSSNSKRSTVGSAHSTRVECAEPESTYPDCRADTTINTKSTTLIVAEQHGVYRAGRTLHCSME